MVEPPSHSAEPSDDPKPSRRAGPRRIPYSLKVIAWVYILLGVLSLTEMLAELAHWNLTLNPGLLGFFVGRGLLKLGNTWRLWVVGLSAIALCLGSLAGFWVIAVTLREIAVWGTGAVATSTYAGIFASLAGLGFVFWQYRVLTHPEIESLFFPPLDLDAPRDLDDVVPADTKTTRFQFSLGTLMLVMVVTAIVLWRLSSGDVLFDTYDRCQRFITGDRTWTVEYGYRTYRYSRRPPIVDYVIVHFSDSENGWTASETYVSEYGRTLVRPDGQEVPLPTRVQLMEIIDGEYRERSERVSFEQLRSFLRTFRPDYSIEALLEFSRTHPAIE